MSNTVFPAIAAVLFAVLLAVALLVPFVVVQYRTRGRLTVGAMLSNFAILLYLLALASYTLLPLPQQSAVFCEVHTARPQLVPGRFIADIISEAARLDGGLGALVRNPAALQLVFNIALFVPLGMIVRHFWRRGILIATLIGLGASLLIEVTQLTGVWFLYPCAYRLFDVDDLLANTAGALLGALLAGVLRMLPRATDADPDMPRRVTVVRRLLGMLCDILVITVGGIALTAALLLVFGAAELQVDPSVSDVLSFGAAPAVMALGQLVLVLASGRTLGEFAVRLRPAGHTSRGWRFARWSLGIGGYTVLSLLPEQFAGLASVAALVCVVLVFATRDHRGLAYVITRRELQDDRTRMQAG